jgi:hypothetical protein
LEFKFSDFDILSKFVVSLSESCYYAAGGFAHVMSVVDELVADALVYCVVVRGFLL